MTTPMRPKTAYSVYLRMMTRVEQLIMAITLRKRNECVRPHGTGSLSVRPFEEQFGDEIES